METATKTQRLHRAKEVARLSRLRPEPGSRIVATGELPSVRLGPKGWHRFRREDVERLIAGEVRFP